MTDSWYDKDMWNAKVKQIWYKKVSRNLSRKSNILMLESWFGFL